MWYIVQPQDTLFQISQRFGVSLEDIINANQLTNAYIFIGQQLYIPKTRQNEINYTVKSGDTLYSISRRFNTLVESIVILNNLTSTSLYPGQILKIPRYSEAIVKVDSAIIRSGPGQTYRSLARMVRNARLPVIASSPGWYKIVLFNGESGWVSANVVNFIPHDGSKPISEILGFYTQEEGPALPSSFRSFSDNINSISETALFMFRISRNNPTQIEKFGTFSDRDVQTLVAIAHRNNVKILPVVHNLLYRPGGQTASKDVVKELLSSKQNRQAFVQNLIRLIERYNFDGVNIDIEDVYYEDRERLSALFIEISNALRSKGYFFSASIPSRVSDAPTNPFSAPFNYSVIGNAVDQFVAMLYNEHGWPGSGPGPVVSIGWMEQVLRYAMSKMPAKKIIAAVSVFGFDFNLTTERNTYVTYQMAVDLAKKYNKEIIFDVETQTPMFSYVDEQGNNHEVWFEDSDSIEAKIRLAWNLGIGGIALWRLGMEDTSIWNMIKNDVVVKMISER